MMGPNKNRHFSNQDIYKEVKFTEQYAAVNKAFNTDQSFQNGEMVIEQNTSPKMIDKNINMFCKEEEEQQNETNQDYD